MKFIKIDPPGSWCMYEAVFQLLKPCNATNFIDVGCGKGDLSFKLCKKGMVGIGVDFSEMAIIECNKIMKQYISSKKYELINGDIMQLDNTHLKQDLAVSLMVIEHVEDDVAFIKHIKKIIKPNGHIIIGAPARMDKWGPEDDSVGHIRRYENYELKRTLEKAGLTNVKIYSIGFPIGNWLFSLSNFLINRAEEMEKVKNMTMDEQTKTSGIRDIPFKTVFPVWFKLFFNKITMMPLYFIQSFFYHTNLGLTIVARGEVPKA